MWFYLRKALQCKCGTSLNWNVVLEVPKRFNLDIQIEPLLISKTLYISKNYNFCLLYFPLVSPGSFNGPVFCGVSRGFSYLLRTYMERRLNLSKFL